MRKFILSIVLLLSVGLSAMVWANADFEDGTLQGASTLDVDGDSYNWDSFLYPVKDGLYGIRSVSEGLTPDNWVITPQIYVERYSSVTYPHIKFSIGAGDTSDFAEHYQVLVSFTDTEQSSFFVVHEETLTSSDWKAVDIDLMPYFTQYQWDASIYVAFRHFDSAGKSALLLDDFMSYTLIDFWWDENGEWSQSYEGVIYPMADMNLKICPYDRSAYDADWNFIGYTAMRMHYIITNALGTQPEDSIEMTLNDDPLYPDTFIHTFPGQPIGTFIEYWFEGVDNSDFHLVGESQHFNVEWGEITFKEEFDEDVIPEGWTRFHTGFTENGWAYDWETWLTANVYSGANAATSASQNNTGPCETENYLVTPRLRIDGDAKLKYYINAETPEGQSESYIFFINNVGGDSVSVVNYSDTLFTEKLIAGPDDNVWYERVIDLKPWSGQFVWIAIKHLYTPYDFDVKLNRYLNLDEFSVAELPKLQVDDPENAARINEDFYITATASDYSGINNVTLYYTVVGDAEVPVVMSDNLDGTYTGIIPGQPEDARCSWYIVATDDSPDLNQTRSSSNDVIWFESGVLEWGSPGTGYTDWPELIYADDKVAMDWNFGTKAYLYLNEIEIGWEYDAYDMPWKLVEFDEVPTENVINGIQGVNTFTAKGDKLRLEGNDSPIYGHVALVFEADNYNEIMLDEAGDKNHAWQYNSSTGWVTNLWGAFYIKMYVSQSGIEDEFVSSTTELCQNYPNPFNPQTSISFYNRLAGDVSLTVYNVKGENVATLVNEKMTEGFRKVDFDASKFNSGVYYYTLKTPEKILTKKMVLVK